MNMRKKRKLILKHNGNSKKYENLKDETNNKIRSAQLENNDFQKKKY
jgi:hypothetical protein